MYHPWSKICQVSKKKFRHLYFQVCIFDFETNQIAKESVLSNLGVDFQTNYITITHSKWKLSTHIKTLKSKTLYPWSSWGSYPLWNATQKCLGMTDFRVWAIYSNGLLHLNLILTTDRHGIDSDDRRCQRRCCRSRRIFNRVVSAWNHLAAWTCPVWVERIWTSVSSWATIPCSDACGRFLCRLLGFRKMMFYLISSWVDSNLNSPMK